ncbi:ATP-binding protein [Aliamphritea ceti]|uniref:ATP-binding protein n=1 Tax=Aliamphritea ceti TaxID=1524258 RepID=UPI0021C2865E|nr:ATP-binding protein [Aliamphritea ceti]
MPHFSDSRHHLLQLSYIRTVTIIAQACLLFYAVEGLGIVIHMWMAIGALLAMTMLNLLTLYRLRANLPLTQLEFLFQLIADIFFYVCLLYQLGGTGNPFSSLLLISLIISAMTLPRNYTWLIAMLVTSSFTFLLFYHIPLRPPLTGHQLPIISYFDLYTTGIWLNFILTALLITYFIVNISENLRRKEHGFNRVKDRLTHDQQLLSLATMAAGTAHEMGTPLATMRVLLKEISLDYPQDQALQDDLNILSQQVDNCTGHLQQLAISVKEEQQQTLLLPADKFLNDLLERWSVLRPTARYLKPVVTQQPQPLIASSIPLQQAIINLLNNAADADKVTQALELRLENDAQKIRINIRDHGQGIPLDQAEDIGKPFVTTKGSGLGIGLFLTASTLTIYGGEVRLYNHPQGGTLTEVSLPIASSVNTSSSSNDNTHARKGHSS